MNWRGATTSGLILLAVALATPLVATLQAVNYDESKVPAYTLPDPLVTQAGAPVADADTWRRVRRGEVLGLFETNVYGKRPPAAVWPVARMVPRWNCSSTCPMTCLGRFRSFWD